MQTGFSPDPHRTGPVEHIGAVSGCDQNTTDGTTADPDRTGPVEHIGEVSGCDQNTTDGTTADPCACSIQFTGFSSLWFLNR